MPQCTRPVIIFATTLCGVAAGLGYLGNLQVVNQIAPERLRAEVVSSYFICCFIGNALPVIGVGVLSAAAGSIMASLVSAATISVFAVLALCFGAKFTHAQKFQTRTRCAQRENIPRGQSRRSRSVANEQRNLVCDHNEVKLLRPRPNQRRETDRSARRWKARWNPSG